jgi:hypothetical protein
MNTAYVNICMHTYNNIQYTVKGTIANVKHDLCTVVKHIVYKISKYLFRETKTGWDLHDITEILLKVALTK